MLCAEKYSLTFLSTRVKGLRYIKYYSIVSIIDIKQASAKEVCEAYSIFICMLAMCLAPM